MNLKIAFSKFSRGLLSSAQLPIVATHALLEGYDSPSLVLLASVYDPSSEDITPLVDTTIQELNIQLQKPQTALSANFSAPLSTESPEFTRSVFNALEKNGELIILQRFAYTGGGGG